MEGPELPGWKVSLRAGGLSSGLDRCGGREDKVYARHRGHRVFAVLVGIGKPRQKPRRGLGGWQRGGEKPTRKSKTTDWRVWGVAYRNWGPHEGF